jgi:hypothetical protein
VRLSAKLELTVDDLLHGEDPSTYRIGRRVGDPRRGPVRAITLLGGITSDLRIDLVQAAPARPARRSSALEGEGIGAVSRGLVRVHVGDQTPAIRDGEVLLAESSRVGGLAQPRRSRRGAVLDRGRAPVVRARSAVAGVPGPRHLTASAVASGSA